MQQGLLHVIGIAMGTLPPPGTRDTGLFGRRIGGLLRFGNRDGLSIGVDAEKTQPLQSGPTKEGDPKPLGLLVMSEEIHKEEKEQAAAQKDASQDQRPYSTAAQGVVAFSRPMEKRKQCIHTTQ
mmetsp:Transcript_31756/g.72956  ORF Transcript_31756/g.72956 Transcript_31756/m.72956 type:complete len:124 (-) Transcript_31756:441-812(-)